MNEHTTLWLKTATKNRISKYGVHRESYDTLLNRIMDDNEQLKQRIKELVAEDK